MQELSESNNFFLSGPENTFEVIEVPSETTSKAALQVQLLRYQIQYTSRDIYYRELTILEKERALSLSTEEKNALLQKSKIDFHNRNL